jgi:predicted transcriptional regulator
MIKGMIIIRKGFYMKKIKDILLGNTLNINHFISTESTIEKAIRKAANTFSKTLFVVDKENIVGIFSMKDFIEKIPYEPRAWLNHKVKDFMTTQIPSINCEVSLSESLQFLQQNDFSCLAVTENNQIIGIVNIDYLIEKTLEEKNFIIDQMMSYIGGGLSANLENVISEFTEYQNIELPILLPEELVQNAA